MTCWGHQAMCCRATGHVGCITHTRHDIGDAMKDTEGLCKTELCLHLSGSPWPTTTMTRGSNSTRTGRWVEKKNENIYKLQFAKPWLSKTFINIPLHFVAMGPFLLLGKKCCLLHVIAQAHRWSLTPGTPSKNGYHQNMGEITPEKCTSRKCGFHGLNHVGHMSQTI